MIDKKNILYLIFLILFSTCESKKTVRQAGLALSFDDRFVKEWTQLRPLLKKYNVKATFYITQPDSLSDEEVLMLHEQIGRAHV